MGGARLLLSVLTVGVVWLLVGAWPARAQPPRPGPPGAPVPGVPAVAGVPAPGGAPPGVPGRAPAGPGPRVIELTPVRLSGTIAAVRPGVILVDTPTQERWTVQVPGDTVVRVTGTAVREVLRAGLFVRFLVRVDERRTRALTKVRRLIIITPANLEGREPGVFPAQIEPPQQPPGAQAGEQQPEAAAELPGDIYDVRARITEIRGRWMKVFAPNTFFKPELRVELDNELQVMVDVSAYGLARPGDQFAALALQVAPQAALAREMVIALSEPVGQHLVKGPRRPTRPGGAQPPEQPGQPGQPAVGPGQPGGVAQAPGLQPPEPGAVPGEQPAGEGQAVSPDESTSKALKIVELLRLKPEELAGKRALQVGINGGEPVVFLPSRQEAVKTIRDRFGPPDRIQPASGTLPIGEGGQQVEIHWNLWTYGPLRFFVDEVGTVRYYLLGEPQAKNDAGQPGTPAQPDEAAPDS